MTLLVTSIAPKNLEELQARAERAWSARAEAVEVRIDAFEGDPGAVRDYLRAHGARTWIVTCRSVKEGGHSRQDAPQRAARLMAASRGTGASVDFELADWTQSDAIRRDVLKACAPGDGGEHQLILSSHDLEGAPAEPASLVAAMAAVPEARTTKLAYHVDHICDSFMALDLMHEHRAMVTAIAMGEDGLWTRVLGRKLGAPTSYCALDAGSATAPGQLTLPEMHERYRWTEINASTRVFGVLGDPVAHSMGPLLFNDWFRECGVDAVYLPLRVRRGGDKLERFLDGCRARKWLDIGGFSVTTPHKAAALKWVGTGADSMAQGIGALNTIALSGDKVTGYNTDAYAAVSSLAAALDCDRHELGDLRVSVLGTGGAAHAVMHGLCELGCPMVVYGRSPERTRRLAEIFGATPAAWEERARHGGDLLINGTSVGMWPDVDRSPMDPEALGRCRLVFDLIYNPLETKLLREARAAGSLALSGLDMFIRQAAAQFELWTGVTPDTSPTAARIRTEITRRSEVIP